MSTRAGLLLLLSSIFLAGCGSGAPTSSGSSQPLPDVSGNWQIQTSESPGGVVAGTVALFGALQSSGSVVSGTFRYSDLYRPTQCGLAEVVKVTGTLDAASHLSLTSGALPSGSVVTIALDVAPGPATTWKGTITVSGGQCAVSAEGALARQVAPVTGTYAGSLSAGPLGMTTGEVAGTVSLVMTQSSTSVADGQFSATGTLSYVFGACTGSVAVSGDASGLGLQFAPATGTGAAPSGFSKFVGTSDPATTPTVAGNFEFGQAPCSTGQGLPVVYSGTLTRQ